MDYQPAIRWYEATTKSENQTDKDASAARTEDGTRLPRAYHRQIGAAMRVENGRIVETAVEARGGLLGGPVLAVLIVSTVVVIVALVLTYAGVVH
jgi:hypothetical protein